MVALLGLAACGPKAEFSLEVGDHPIVTPAEEVRIAAIYDAMLPQERLMQLSGVNIQELVDENYRLDTAKCRALIPFGIGHLDQFASTSPLEPNALRDLVADIQTWVMENTPSGIPILCHDEVIDGADTYGATTYPQSIGLAGTFDPALVELEAFHVGRNMRSIGALIGFGPMVDVDRNPYFNRNEESYGEDAYLSASMSAAFVRGLQRDGMRNGIGACSKHFLGYGGGALSQDREIMEEILLPHETAIRVGGSKAIMSGYHVYRDTSAVANHAMLTGILRDYLGFDGMTVSDYGSVNQIEHTEDTLQRAVDALHAGNNVELHHLENYRMLPQAVAEGLVNEDEFEQAVKNVLRYKMAVGMLDEHPKLYAGGEIVFDTPEERRLAYKLAAESIVLLKNDGILPLTSPGRIVLVGPNAGTIWGLLGDYTYQAMTYFWRFNTPDATFPKLVTFKEGLESKLKEGSSIVYERGCEWVEEPCTVLNEGGDDRIKWVNSFISRLVPGDMPSDWDKAMKTASESDVIVACMGENTLLCGENRDRGSIRLPGRQEEFVRALVATGKPVVLVISGGRTQVIGDLAQQCAAVLQTWYPGEEGGNALADILYGNISPSGKLSVAYPREEIEENICYNYSMEQDSRIQWPFGYGLSYSSFEYSDLQLPSSVKTSDKSWRLSFTVKNTGEMQADEIAQIYFCPTEEGQSLKPIRLQGFGRVSLAPGEEKTLSFLVSPQQFGSYQDGHWEILPGKWEIKVGGSSQDLRLSRSIMLKGSKVSMPLRTVYFSEMQ